MKNLVTHCLDGGGIIKPLVIPAERTNGTALFNPSIFVEGDRLLVNIRHCQYTLYHSDLGNYEHQWGPLLYLNPENDVTLTTTNYIGDLSEDLELSNIRLVDTSGLDVKPIWTFIGLEDGRLLNWNNKYYLTGVRRDTTTNGQGRMELSEIEITDTSVKEIRRDRIPAPGEDNTYCEKNWMPIIDQPYRYVKWGNPVEIVEYNPETKETEQIHIGEYDNTITHDPRGGSHCVPYKGGYLALHHVTYNYKSEAGRKNATYRHQFSHWDKYWNLIKRSRVFDFMSGKIEFTCGMAPYKGDYLITFGYQDNAAFIIKISEDSLEDFINA